MKARVFVLLLVLASASIWAAPPPTTQIFTGESLSSRDFTNVDLRNARFDNTTLSDINFVRADLREASFTRCRVSSAVFSGADADGADFTDADLSSARLAGILNFGKATLKRAQFRDLTGVRLIGANLARAPLIQARMYRTELLRANLRGAQLMQAQMVHADLRSANLQNAEMMQANLRDAELLNADLAGAQLAQAWVDGADFRGCHGLTQAMVDGMFATARTKLPPTLHLPETITPPPQWDMTKLREPPSLSGQDFTAAVFDHADLHDLDLHNADLPVSMLGANLKEADLSGARAEKTDFTDADLEGMKLARAFLSGAKLSSARNLAHCDFSGAYLDDADFSGSHADLIILSGAYLHRAKFAGAHLSGAALDNADLREADLTGADLTNANLAGANLMGAKLKGANLAGVDLQQTFGLQRPQLQALAGYEPTKLPDRLAPPAVLNHRRDTTANSSRAGGLPKPTQSIANLHPLLVKVIFLAGPTVIGLLILRIIWKALIAGGDTARPTPLPRRQAPSNWQSPDRQ